MKKQNGRFFIAVLLAAIAVSAINIAAGAPQKKGKKQAKAGKTKSEVIATVGTENITFADLEKSFKKNLNRKDLDLFSVSKDSLYDFLNLYINYRLKVADAIERGFDKDPAVISDMEHNRKILAESFYYDKQLTEPNVAKMLEHRDHEFQISIIIFHSAGPNGDSVVAYQRAKNILQKLLDGADFATMARDSSDDKTTAALGGLLPAYYTAGSMQAPIENAVYKIKPGEIYPEVISSKFGYFILKLMKDEPRYKVKASHILFAPDEDKKDTTTFVAEAEKVFEELKNGGDFGAAAAKYSKDSYTAQKGGALGEWYSRSTGLEGSGRQLNLELADAIFKLKDGEIGKVKTEYGIHIVRRDSTREIDVAAEKEELKKLYKRVYWEADKRTHLNKLKASMGFDLKEPVLRSLVSNIDSTKTALDTNLFTKVPQDLMQKPIFLLGGQGTTVSDFIKALRTRNELKASNLTTEGLKKAVDKIVDPIVFESVSKNLESEYPEFSLLMNEFRDGILLFKVEALEVWDRLKFDTVLAKAYYDSTKSKYKTIKKYDISEVYVLSDSLAKEVYNLAKSGTPFDSLAVRYTQRNTYKERKGHWGKIAPKDGKLAQIPESKNAKAGDVLEPFQFDRGWSIVKVNAIDMPRQKTFEESIPDIAPEVQDIIQKTLLDKWLAKLRASHNVTINKEVIEKTLESK